MNKILFITMTAALLFVGCTADEQTARRGDGLVPISLTTTVGEVGITTRAATDLQGTQLPSGATFVAKFSNDVTPSQVTYQADGSGGTTVAIANWDGTAQTATVDGTEETIGVLTIGAILDQTYTGSAITPALTVTKGGVALTSNDYICHWFNNTAVGTATVVVIGQGSYADFRGYATFNILEPPFSDIVTSADVGKIVCSNGHLHASVSAVNCGGVASALIAYVGSEGSVETGSNYKGIAIALADCSSSNCGFWNGTDLKLKWGYVQSANDYTYCTGPVATDVSTAITLKNGIARTTELINHSTANHDHYAAKSARSYNVSRPNGVSEWFLPSAGQWNLIVQGLAASTTNLSKSANNAYKASSLNSVLGSAALKTDATWDTYWTCTGYSTDYIGTWDVDFGNGKLDTAGAWISTCYVRSAFAF